MDSDPIFERAFALANPRRGIVVIGLGFATVAAIGLAAVLGWSAVNVAVTFCAILLAAGAGWLAGLAAGRAHAVPPAVPARDPEGERKAAARADEVRRQAVATVLEGLPDPVILLDPTAKVRFANSATRTIVPTAAPGKHIASVTRTPGLLDAVEQVRQGEPAQIVEYTVPVPVALHLEAHVLPLRFPGDPTGPDGWSIMVVIRDLTGVKRLEQMRADFIANASHELRTPLASLAGFIDTLQGHARRDPEAQQKFMGIMADQVGRMGRLIDDLLSLSRIELNEHVAPGKSLDVYNVIRDVADAMGPLLKEHGVTLDVDAQADLMVLGERDELVQVFQNLVHNALKYAASGKRIVIAAQCHDNAKGLPVGAMGLEPLDTRPLDAGGASASTTKAARQVLTVMVRDFGPGIASEHIPRLTERFYRIDARQSRRSGGTGLGLAIVKHIVNRHRGYLQISSIEGEGSVFAVHLPLVGRNETLEDPVRTVYVGPESRAAARSPRDENPRSGPGAGPGAG